MLKNLSKMVTKGLKTIKDKHLVFSISPITPWIPSLKGALFTSYLFPSSLSPICTPSFFRFLQCISCIKPLVPHKWNLQKPVQFTKSLHTLSTSEAYALSTS